MKILNTLPLVALMMLAGCNKTPTPTADKAPAEKPVATVNGIPISRAMFDYYIKNGKSMVQGEAMLVMSP